jgi:hypothetical protein
MRAVFSDGDLISAEVQQIMQDGTVSLHTRQLKYGKLQGGQLVQVREREQRRRAWRNRKQRFRTATYMWGGAGGIGRHTEHATREIRTTLSRKLTLCGKSSVQRGAGLSLALPCKAAPLTCYSTRIRWLPR